MTEKFTITITLPKFLLEVIDELRQSSTRSKYVDEVVGKTDIEDIYKLFQGTSSVSLNLSFENIEKLKEMAEVLNTNPGRVLYMILLNHVCFSSPSPLGLASMSSPFLKEGEENG